MLKFTKEVEISVTLLNLLRDKPQRIKDLVDKCATTHHMLNTVSAKLKRAGLIDTIKGRNGGLKKKFDKIKLYDVIRVFEKQPHLNDSIAGDILNQYLIEFYRNLPVSLIELAEIYQLQQEPTVEPEKEASDGDPQLKEFEEWSKDNLPTEVSLREFEEEILNEIADVSIDGLDGW